jgi:hypothetical protein
MNYAQDFNFFVRPVNFSAKVWRKRHRGHALTAPAHNEHVPDLPSAM